MAPLAQMKMLLFPHGGAALIPSLGNSPWRTCSLLRLRLSIVIKHEKCIQSSVNVLASLLV